MGCPKLSYHTNLTIRRDGQRERQFYVKDHLGSTRAVISDKGHLLSMYDYQPFGDVLESTVGETDPPQKFTGHEFDDEGGLNLHHMVARIYDGDMGRFYSVDPMAYLYPGYTPYHYTLNNPVNFIDPTGEYVVRGTNVTRMGRNTARAYNIASLTGVGSIAAVANRKRINDPSFQNTTMDYVFLGVGGYLKGTSSMIRKMGDSGTGISTFERIRTGTGALMSGTGAFLNSMGDVLVGDTETFQNIVKDEIIFNAATRLKTPSGELLGELSKGGTEFNVFESVIYELGGNTGVENLLKKNFGELNNAAMNMIEIFNLDLSKEHHSTFLQSHLNRTADLMNN